MGLLSRSDKINRSPRLGDYFSFFCFNAAESQLQSILSNVAGGEFMKGSVDKYYCVIDYAEGNVQDKKSQGTDTLGPLLRKIGHL